LAFEITSTYHNVSQAEDAEKFFQETVQNRNVEGASIDLNLDKTNLNLLELCQKAMPEETSSQLRRLIEQGAVSLNDQKMIDQKAQVSVKNDDILKIGKRNYFKIKL
jgi:tyrosyl-tRNA synthetase